MLGIKPLKVKGVDEKYKTLDGGLLAAMAMRAVKLFCQSDAREIDGSFLRNAAGIHEGDQDSMRDYLLPFAHRIWEDAVDVNGRLPYGHDRYLKTWEMNHPVISADYLLIDERQDLSRVMLSIAEQQVKLGLKVIMVGDAAQAIYGFLGCVDAATAFPDAKKLYLSQSFRFGETIAAVANAVLSNLDKPTDLVLRGLLSIPSRLANIDAPDAVLCRTNAAAVQTVLTAIDAGKRPHLVGGGDEVLRFVNAARDLQCGRRTDHPELAIFESWNEVKAFSKLDEGADLKLMVKLIDTFTADAIASALKHMPDEKDADLVVSTCHRAKGKEWNRVKLASDFMPLSKMGDEELRLLYVAATRAKLILDVESCPPFCGGKDHEQFDEKEDGRAHLPYEVKVINLTTARKLSEQCDKIGSTSDAPAGVVSQSQIQAGDVDGLDNRSSAVFDSLKPQRNGRDDGNSWTKGKDGRWRVRGKPGQSGVVTVCRRDGSKSQETLGKVVWQDSNVALYDVIEKERTRR